MRNFRSGTCDLSCALNGIIQPACCRNTHGRTVTVAAVGLRIFCMNPVDKSSAVACIRITLTPFLHRADAFLADGLSVGVTARFHQRFHNRNRHYGIIRKMTAPRIKSVHEQRKILRPAGCIKFKYAANNISNNCSVHFFILLFSAVSGTWWSQTPFLFFLQFDYITDNKKGRLPRGDL